MARRLVLAACAFAVAVCVGCGGATEQSNPDNLPYGKGEPLPKKDVKMKG